MAVLLLRLPACPPEAPACLPAFLKPQPACLCAAKVTIRNLRFQGVDSGDAGALAVDMVRLPALLSSCWLGWLLARRRATGHHCCRCRCLRCLLMLQRHALQRHLRPWAPA